MAPLSEVAVQHGFKVVDGVPIKYICEPCPECKKKLEAAEETLRALKIIIACEKDTFQEGMRQAKAAIGLWQKVGKGK